MIGVYLFKQLMRNSIYLSSSLKKNFFFLFLFLFIFSSCSKDGLFNRIKVSNLIDPDKEAPSIEFISTPTSLNGDRDYTLQFKAIDNPGGGGVRTVEVFYSPDALNIDYKKIGTTSPGENASLKFCVPNKNHPQPAFKIIATDKSGNKTESFLGDSGPAFSINLSNPNPPTLSSNDGLLTNQSNVELAINQCRPSLCSADAKRYEPLDNSLFVLINSSATKPLATDPSWVTCSDVLTNGFTPSNFTVNGDYTYHAWLRSTEKDFDQTTDLHMVSDTSTTVTVKYDTVAPTIASTLVEGTNLTGQSKGTYKLNACGDIAFVKITKGLGAPPLASDSGWQVCSDTTYSLITRDFLPGDNNLQFWVKDAAENVTTSFLPYTTKYVPPTISVVGGSTISDPIADMTIQFCNEAYITKVLFNETGVTPTSTTDSKWQTCSTVAGILKSDSLSPGVHTLKAYFQYSDGNISPNAINVPVTYSPTLSWFDSPSVNRPQTRFTVASCTGVTHVLLNKTTAPLASDPLWVPCLTTAGALTFNNLSPGTQTVNAWFKDAAGNVLADYATASATYTPPEALLNNGTTITASRAKLTITDCQNVSKVLVSLDDATMPSVGDANWVNCSTANNAISSPLLSGLGNHTLYTWFKFTDNYIIPNADIDNIVYDPDDATPPNISSVSLTLNNGYGGSTPYLLVKTPGSYVPTTPSEHVSRANFTINTCTPTGSSDPKEDITRVLITTESNIANIQGTNPYWQTCSTAANAIQSATLDDGIHQLYFYYKDLAGNIAGYNATTNISQTNTVETSTAADVTPPPRPYVEIINPPTLTSSPAQMWVNDPNNCNDIDQVYVNIYSRQYDGMSTETLNEAAPLKTSAGWQNCKVKPGSYTMPVDLGETFNFPLILSGSYTLNVWFKDNAGNINPNARRVSFIFNPVASPMPNPIAHWSFDKNHFDRNRLADGKGSNHLVIWKHSLTKSTTSNGKIKEGYDLSGNTFAIAKNSTALKPTVSVAMSAWVYLTQNDTGPKFIAGNLHNTGGYGFSIEGSKLKFTVNGRSAEVATSSYTTGLHLITGSSDGQITDLYIDGTNVGTDDAGTPQNIYQGTSNIFTVGVKPGSGPNFDTTNPNYFNGKIDELVVWNKHLTSTQVFRHYVDGMNILKVNEQHATPSPTLSGASYYGEFMQNALLTMNSCNGIRWVYVNETTHPPTKDTTDWQPCNTYVGGIVHPNLSQGYHELKIWTKDEYDNLSSTYIKVDTTITGLVYQVPPVTYFTMDNNHLLAGVNTIINDIFNGLVGDVVGPSSNQTGVGFTNEGFLFNRAEADFIEALYAANSQVENRVTLSAWAKLTKNDNRAQVIAGNRTGSQGYALLIDNTTNELSFVIETTAGTRKASVPTSSYENGFTNIIGTYDGQVVTLYLNGKPVTDTDYGTVAQIQYTCLSSFTIGAGATCNLGAQANTYFDNSIDEIIMWDDVLSASTILDFFNGQDTVPPLPVAVIPKDNNYTVTLPIAKLRTDNCDDIGSVYVALDGVKPTADAANWQTCSSTLYSIKSPLLENGANNLRVWFKDAAGNVSDTSTNLTITFNYDFTVPNPLAYWPFDLTTLNSGLALDVFGNFHAQMNNLATTSGVSDEALTFNGSNGYAEVPHAAALNFVDTVSMSIWFNISSFPASEKFLMGKYNAGGYAITLNSNVLTFKVVTDNTPAPFSASITHNLGGDKLNSWVNVVAVYDRGAMKLLVNGIEVANTQLPEVSTGITPKLQYATNTSFNIGASSTTSTGANGNFFNGKLDDAALFAEALNDTVAAEIYKRGSDGDKTAYDTVPPEIPVNLNILYYNALVSRANLTVTDCTGLEFIIVTKSTFPPSKTDEDWQPCNTLTGGLLSKQLSTADTYGKLWTKDRFGNVSKTFQYIPVNTYYDKPIQRPAAHWTFDTSHFNNTTKKFLDRLGNKEAISEAVEKITSDSHPVDCPDPDGTGPLDYGKRWCYPLTQTTAMTSVNGGVLNQRITGTQNKWLRVDDTSSVSYSDKLSVAAWVYIPNNYDPAIPERHIVSIWEGGKGYAIRMVDDISNPRVEFVVKPQGQTALAPYLETKNLLTGWHLILGTYDASTGAARLYVDGIFIKQFTSPTPAPVEYTSGTKFMIGANPNLTNFPDGYVFSCTYNSYSYSSCIAGSDVSYNNNIDEVLVWNKVVTGLEASSLYHNGADLLYPTDTTAPALPSLKLENSRPTIHTNKAYLSVSSCNDISGVLVNEGTMPDKQDDRWQICRTRLGSFGIKNLTPGGHTITFWFKDLAGNVTPVSQDYVVDYVYNLVPRSNAYWPLDKTHSVSSIARDVVSESAENDLHITGLERSNPTANYVLSKVGKGINLVDSHLTKYDILNTNQMSRLIRPVNFLSIGGWFYLTNADAGSKVLVDNHHTSTPLEAGYILYMSGGQLRFRVGLDLSVFGNTFYEQTYAMSSITTGWHHVVGVWTGEQVKIYVDGAPVSVSAVFPEENYIRYIDNSNNPILTYFRVGASSSIWDIPGSYFNDKIDEVAIWGFDLTNAQTLNTYNSSNSGNYLENITPTPNNVDNAFVYFHDQFGARVRLTMLDCTNTPYLYVGPYNGVAVQPDPESSEWRDCRLEPGAILSAKLPTGIPAPQYVHVWSKNAFGVVSTIPATLEIPTNTNEDELELPSNYYSFNEGHIAATNAPINFFTKRNGSYPTATLVSGSNGNGLSFSDTQYFSTGQNFNLYFKRGFTLSVWANINKADVGNRTIIYPSTNDGVLNLSLNNGNINFQINRSLDAGRSFSFQNDYDVASSVSVSSNFVLSYPMSLLPQSGWTMLTISYDQQNMNLYINGELAATQNAPQTQYQTLVNKPVNLSTTPAFRLSHSTTGLSFLGAMDEFMTWEYPLTQQELIRHYVRVAHKLYSTDSTAPDTSGRTITLVDSTEAGGKWPTVHPNPTFTINNCTDVAGIYISINDATVPRYDNNGWISCNELIGGITLPNGMTVGDNDIRIWIKDLAGNVNSVPLSTIITYTQPSHPNPVAYWSFDNNTIYNKQIYDLSNNHIRTELFGVSTTAGKANEALAFDARRSFVKVYPHNAYKPTDQLSLSYWYNTGGGSTCQGEEHLFGTGDKNLGYSVRLEGGTGMGCGPDAHLTLDITIDSVRYHHRVPAYDLPSGWVHIVHTFDGRYIKTYANSTLARTDDLKSIKSINYTTDQVPLIMGAAPENLNPPRKLDEITNNTFDEFAIFNKALTSYQVTEVYNKGNSATRVYDPARSLENDAGVLSSRFSIYNVGNVRTFANRIKASVSNCTDIDLVMVTDSTTAPSANSKEWQKCTTTAGGILSAPMGIFGSATDVTPRLWVRTFNGVVSTNYGTASNAPVSIKPVATNLPRPTAYWTMNSQVSNHQSATEVFDFIGDSPMKKVNLFEPDPVAALEGDGFSFDGVSKYLEIPATPNTNAYNDLSISLWAYLRKGENVDRTLLSNASGTSGAGIRTTNLGQLEFFVWTLQNGGVGSTYYAIDNTKTYFSTSIDTNVYQTGWRHITATYNGRALKLYLDGTLVSSYEIQFYNADEYRIFHDDKTPWMIGAQPGATAVSAGVNVTTPSGSYYNDKLDEISFYDTELTNDQIYYLYLYGTQFKAGFTEDAIAPNDPGIALESPTSTLNSPFAFFTTPSCTAPNGQPINSLYINLSTDPAPLASDSGWQFCSLDAAFFRSPLLDRGSNTVRIYIRDNDNDISTPIDFNVTYDPPDSIDPLAYYTFDFADRENVNNDIYYDLMGAKRITAAGGTYENYYIGGGIRGDAYYTYDHPTGGTSYQAIVNTYSQVLTFDKNFAVSFWIYPKATFTNMVFIQKAGEFSISRNGSDQVVFSLLTRTGSYSKTTTQKLKPNEWNYVSVVRQDNTAKIFLNENPPLSFTVNNDIMAKSNSRVTVLDTEGIIDEIALYNNSLTDEQVFFNYFKGAKATKEAIDYNVPNYLAPKFPTHYYNFDESQITLPVRTLNDVTGNNDLTFNEGLLPVAGPTSNHSGSFSKVGESVFIDRYETVVNNPDTDAEYVNQPPETANTVGDRQFLEAGSALNLGVNFSIAGWVNFTKSTFEGHNNREYYTVFDQWGDTVSDQSFMLYQHLASPNRFLAFTFKIGSSTYNLTGMQNPLFNTWYHVAIVRKGEIVAMYINGEEAASVDTNNIADPIATSSLAKLRFGESNMTNNDERRFEGYLDEWAFWNDSALSLEQVRDIYARGNAGNPIYTEPTVILTGSGSQTNLTNAPLTINDCGGYTHVFVGFDTDTPPTDITPGWQVCSTAAGAILTNNLTADSLNQLRLWFRTNTVVSSYTVDIDVTHVTTDSTPPALPGSVTLASANPTTSAFATFTISSCNDAASSPAGQLYDGVYIGKTTPIASQDGWVPCTTAVAGHTSPPLEAGNNTLSVWFKDQQGNIAKYGTDFIIRYNMPQLPKAEMFIGYSTGNSDVNKEFNQITTSYVRESISQNIFNKVNPNDITFDTLSIAEEGAEFSASSYLETSTYNPSLTGTTFSYSSWIRIPVPSIQASLINQWDGTASNNRFAVTIDSVGRLCFDFQTTTSIGSASWNTNSYRHSCSVGKITFSEWNHVLVTRNGSSVQYYINGSFAGNDTIDPAPLKNSTLSLRIAAQGRGGYNFNIEGQTDETALWNENLSSDQAEAVFAKGYNEKVLFEEVQPQFGAIADLYFDMDNANYTIAASNYQTGIAPYSGTPLFRFDDLDTGVTNNFTTPVTGIVGDARYFDYKNILEASVADIGLTTNFTIALWLKPEFTFGDNQNPTIINKWENTDVAPTTHASNQLKLKLIEGSGQFTPEVYFHTTASDTWGSQGYTKMVSDYKFSNNTWNHLVITRNGNYLSLYLNGKLAKTQNIGSAPLVNSPIKMRLGGTTNTMTPGKSFRGSIDEFAIWNSSLKERSAYGIYKAATLAVPQPVNMQLTFTPYLKANSITTVGPETIQAPLTISGCSIFTKVLVQSTSDPDVSNPLDPRWVTCDSNFGAISSPNLNSGANVLEIWGLDGSNNIVAPIETKTINYNVLIP